MGMLTLAGAVSGGGKALQQGLAQTQQYMSQSMLLKEREDMERARMDITYGRALGILQKRQDFDREAADLAHSRALDREDQRQAFEAGENRKTRDARRQEVEAQSQRELDKEERTQQRTVTNKVLDTSFEQQKDAREERQARGKEERDRKERRMQHQEDLGREIVTETIRNQRPHTGGSASGDGSGKWDDQTKARYKSLVAEISDIKESLYGLVKAPEKDHPALKKRLADLQREHDGLIGRQSTQSDRPQYRFPD